MLSTTNTPVVLPDSQIIAECIVQIQKFFDGDSIEKVRADLENLLETTVTESYSDLDKDDKWLTFYLFRRISSLVETVHLLTLNK